MDLSISRLSLIERRRGTKLNIDINININSYYDLKNNSNKRVHLQPKDNIIKNNIKRIKKNKT
jgi:hypothetical protein